MNRHTLSARLLMLVVPGLLMIAACGSGDTEASSSQAGLQPDDLVGQTFTFTDVQVSDTGAPPPNDGDGITLTFTDDGITATGGCNTMSGRTVVSSGELVVTDGLAMTEMGCEAKLMDQDTWLADLLTGKPSMTVDGQTLTLATGGTVLTLSEATAEEPTASLTGTNWQLDTMIDGDLAASVPTSVTSTLAFADDGQVRVQFGCNSGGGSYTSEGDTITFGPLSSTLMLCAGPREDVESAVNKVLAGAVTYALDGQSLTLTNAQSGLVYRTS